MKQTNCTRVNAHQVVMAKIAKHVLVVAQLDAKTVAIVLQIQMALIIVHVHMGIQEHFASNVI